jgi:hypothetical protein
MQERLQSPMRIIDDVRRDFALQHYNDVVERLGQELRGQRSVLALGMFGAVTHPGISDLDVIVVTSDACAAAVLHGLRRWIAQDAVAHHLFRHAPLVLSKPMVPALLYVCTLSGLRWLYRHEECPLPEPPTSTITDYLDLVYVSFLLPGAAKLVGDRTVRLRPALLVLKHLQRYCESLGRIVGLRVVHHHASEDIRRLVLDTPPGDAEIGGILSDEYGRTVRQLCRLLDQVGERYPPTGGSTAGLPRWLPRRDTAMILPAQTTAFERHLGYVVLRVHGSVFSRLVGPWYWAPAPDSAAAQYRRAYENIARLARQERIRQEFITPFGYPFGDTGWRALAQTAAWKAILMGKQLADGVHASFTRRAHTPTS